LLTQGPFVGFFEIGVQVGLKLADSCGCDNADSASAGDCGSQTRQRNANPHSSLNYRNPGLNAAYCQRRYFFKNRNTFSLNKHKTIQTVGIQWLEYYTMATSILARKKYKKTFFLIPAQNKPFTAKRM
jgi:hypothetical protein